MIQKRREALLQKKEGGYTMKHKKWLSVLLAAVMVLAMLPTAAFAEQAGVNGSSVVRI